MPELPEVETVCRGLQKLIIGDTICDAKVLRSDSIGYPDPAKFASKIRGHKIERVYRRGKYILIDLDRAAGMAVHLRMSGRLMVVDKKAPPERFLRVRMSLASGRDLRFEDMRVFGRIWYVPPGKTFEQIIPSLAELGAEPLEKLTGKSLGEVLRGKKQPIKSALMDQRVLAGIGNIYADEALFGSRIHPLRQAGDLRDHELDELAKVIRSVLESAIERRGTTLRDYVDADGVNGNYQHSAWVYGREGEPCRVCGLQIERTKIGGRSSHFCVECQPARYRKGAAVVITKTTRKK
ncbi:MAG TPA: bifunctional DNA-formamidopyrimidine glycosylase/DNA-(apurinic or apyrimidinic site) lyase [Planktothrix sp.]|jgi:formamidopyrimidine-DNA glycosylase